MINPNSKRGRAMLLAAQAQERPAAPPQPAAARERPAVFGAPVARPPLRENPARSYSLGDDDWGARRPVAKVQRPAAAHDARARREARRQAVAAQAPAPAPEPVIVKPVVPEEPVVPKEAGPPVSKRCFSLEHQPQSVSIAPDGKCVVAGFASGVVRLFDLTSTPQPEDRWGCALGVVGTNAHGILKVHVEISDDGKMLFAGARTGKGFRAWDLQHFHLLRETRGFASSTRVRSYPSSDARLRGFCSVATTSQGYRLLCGVGYGHMTVWDLTINDNVPTWTCAFHEHAGGPALRSGVLCAGGSRAITRVAEKPLRVWRLDAAKAEHHAIPDTCGDEGVLVRGGLEGRTTQKGAVALLGMGCGELRATHLRDLKPDGGSTEAPLTADTIQLPPPDAASGRRRQRSVQAVSACRGAEAAAIHLDDGHVALLTYESTPTIQAWLAPRESTSVHVTLGSVADDVVAACVVFDADRGVGVLRYASLENAEAGSLRLLDDDTTAVVDRSSSENWEDRLAGGCWNCGGSDECWAPEVRGPVSVNASRRRRLTPSPRRDPAPQARAVPCKRAEPEALEAPPPPKRRRSSTEKPIDVTAESDEDEESASKLRQRLEATQRLLRESRAAHDEDLRRADRRFEEEKRLRKEWNDARRAYERRLDDAHSERALLETEFRGGDLTFDMTRLDGVHHKLTEALKRNRALAQRRAERDARGPNCVSCALRAPTVAFAPCGHRALCAQCEGELKRRDALERCPCCKERVLATVHVRDLSFASGDEVASSSPWG